MMVFTSPVSVYFLALTSFLIPHEELSTFPDQYIFVLQYWVSSSSHTAISGEFSVTEATLDSLSAWTCWYCSSESVPKNTHSCMGPLSNVWRQERNVESVAGPGPRPPTGWDTLTKMTYDVCSPQPGQPQLMVWCLIQTWRGTTISSWCTPCTPPWTWSWYPDTHPGLDCRHMAAPT